MRKSATGSPSAQAHREFNSDNNRTPANLHHRGSFEGDLVAFSRGTQRGKLLNIVAAQAPSSSRYSSLRQLQTLANNFVTTSKGGCSEHPQKCAPENVAQLYSYTHGPLRHDSGTEIKTDVIAPWDIGGGSNVSAWPHWWPTGAAETANDFLRENFVQGHLLNQKLGGPGDHRYNLTPITRSTNSQMSASIENAAKQILLNGRAIKYWVTADYSSHPNVSDVGAGHLSPTEQHKLQAHLNRMPGVVGAQITVYDSNGVGGWTKAINAHQPNDIYVKNEGQALKGSFV